MAKIITETEASHVLIQNAIIEHFKRPFTYHFIRSDIKIRKEKGFHNINYHEHASAKGILLIKYEK